MANKSAYTEEEIDQFLEWQRDYMENNADYTSMYDVCFTEALSPFHPHRESILKAIQDAGFTADESETIAKGLRKNPSYGVVAKYVPHGVFKEQLPLHTLYTVIIGEEEVQLPNGELHYINADYDVIAYYVPNVEDLRDSFINA